MSYSSEIVARAQARLANSKEERESENRQRLAKAYARVPRIREIDIALRKTMVVAAQNAFVSGSDARQALEEARIHNLALQQERRELAARYFEEGYLDEIPICEHCGGHGYVGSSMCECLAELCRQEQKKELVLLSGNKESFNQFRLDYYSDIVDPQVGTSPRFVMDKTFHACRTYAATFSQYSGNLLFVGGTGLGKTFLAACIARMVADRGYSVIYETASHLFAKLERAKFGGDEAARKEAERFAACDLLILDDLGTEMPGQFVTSALYSLLSDRLMASKPMVVTTNLNIDEIRRRYTPQIASRLEGSFRRLTFLGEDIRVLKNRG